MFNSVFAHDRALTSRGIKTAIGTIVKVNNNSTVNVRYTTEPTPENEPIEITATQISILYISYDGLSIVAKPRLNSPCLLIFIQDPKQEGVTNSVKSCKCLPFEASYSFADTPMIKTANVIIADTSVDTHYVALANKCNDNFNEVLRILNLFIDAAGSVIPPVPVPPVIVDVSGTVIKTK